MTTVYIGQGHGEGRGHSIVTIKGVVITQESGGSQKGLKLKCRS